MYFLCVYTSKSSSPLSVLSCSISYVRDISCVVVKIGFCMRRECACTPEKEIMLERTQRGLPLLLCSARPRPTAYSHFSDSAVETTNQMISLISLTITQGVPEISLHCSKQHYHPRSWTKPSTGDETMTLALAITTSSLAGSGGCTFELVIRTLRGPLGQGAISSGMIAQYELVGRRWLCLGWYWLLEQSFSLSASCNLLD
ncbi:hypothetical protein BJX70DRAFT_360061, partial [Aspergillus crustosus]